MLGARKKTPPRCRGGVLTFRSLTDLRQRWIRKRDGHPGQSQWTNHWPE